MKSAHEGAEAALSGGQPRKPKGKAKSEMHVRHADNGGYIVKHHHMHPDGTPGPQHGKETIHPDLKSVYAHMDKHMGQGSTEAEPGAPEPEEEAEEQAV